MKTFLASYFWSSILLLSRSKSAAGSSLEDAVIYDCLTKSVFSLLFGNTSSCLWCNFEIQDRSKDLIFEFFVPNVLYHLGREGSLQQGEV